MYMELLLQFAKTVYELSYEDSFSWGNSSSRQEAVWKNTGRKRKAQNKVFRNLLSIFRKHF